MSDLEIGKKIYITKLQEVIHKIESCTTPVECNKAILSYSKKTISYHVQENLGMIIEGHGYVIMSSKVFGKIAKEIYSKMDDIKAREFFLQFGATLIIGDNNMRRFELEGNEDE